MGVVSKLNAKNENFVIAIFAMLVVILMINQIQIISLKKGASSPETSAAEQAEISLIVIEATCGGCFDISDTIDSAKTGNAKVLKEENFMFDSERAKELIAKYNIKKLPAVIVTGEVEKVNLAGFEKVNDALVFQANSPYIDAETGNVAGRISVIYLRDFNCKVCTDLSEAIEGLKAAGIPITDEKIVEAGSNDGRSLINKYQIKVIPTLIFSSELSMYNSLIGDWSRLGTIESDGSYATRKMQPPYFDLAKNKIVGVLSITYLTDNTCTTCYDATIHKQILGSLGFSFASEKTADINSESGKRLIKDYNIKKAPTFIIAGDLKAYETYPALEDVGRFIGDAYIFEKVEVMQGGYRDLESGEIINTTVEKIVTPNQI